MKRKRKLLKKWIVNWRFFLRSHHSSYLTMGFNMRLVLTFSFIYTIRIPLWRELSWWRTRGNSRDWRWSHNGCSPQETSSSTCSFIIVCVTGCYKEANIEKCQTTLQILSVKELKLTNRIHSQGAYHSTYHHSLIHVFSFVLFLKLWCFLFLTCYDYNAKNPNWASEWYRIFLCNWLLCRSCQLCEVSCYSSKVC